MTFLVNGMSFDQQPAPALCLWTFVGDVGWLGLMSGCDA
jgi:hypothetical protein